MGIGHKRSITSVFKLLANQGVNVEELKEKINDVAIKTILCGLPHMSHQYKCSQPEDYSGSMCFHILGLDIMLNNKA
jgi:tubulin polyglutamylase TTLL6/13